MTNEENRNMRIRRPIGETVFAKIEERIMTLTEDPDDFLVVDLDEDKDSVLFIQAVRCGDGCHVEVAFDMDDFGWKYPLVLAANLDEKRTARLLRELLVDVSGTEENELVLNCFKQVPAERYGEKRPTEFKRNDASARGKEYGNDRGTD